MPGLHRRTVRGVLLSAMGASSGVSRGFRERRVTRRSSFFLHGVATRRGMTHAVGDDAMARRIVGVTPSARPVGRRDAREQEALTSRTPRPAAPARLYR